MRKKLFTLGMVLALMMSMVGMGLVGSVAATEHANVSESHWDASDDANVTVLTDSDDVLGHHLYLGEMTHEDNFTVVTSVNVSESNMTFTPVGESGDTFQYEGTSNNVGEEIGSENFTYDEDTGLYYATLDFTDSTGTAGETSNVSVNVSNVEFNTEDGDVDTSMTAAQTYLTGASANTDSVPVLADADTATGYQVIDHPVSLSESFDADVENGAEIDNGTLMVAPGADEVTYTLEVGNGTNYSSAGTVDLTLVVDDEAFRSVTTEDGSELASQDNGNTTTYTLDNVEEGETVELTLEVYNSSSGHAVDEALSTTMDYSADDVDAGETAIGSNYNLSMETPASGGTTFSFLEPPSVFEETLGGIGAAVYWMMVISLILMLPLLLWLLNESGRLPTSEAKVGAFSAFSLGGIGSILASQAMAWVLVGSWAIVVVAVLYLLYERQQAESAAHGGGGGGGGNGPRYVG